MKIQSDTEDILSLKYKAANRREVVEWAIHCKSVGQAEDGEKMGERYIPLPIAPSISYNTHHRMLGFLRARRLCGASSGNRTRKTENT